MKTKQLALKIFLIISIISITLFGIVDRSHAQDSSGMYIDDFQTEIKPDANSWVKISEKITFVYETPHHGFLRYIPYRYHDKYGNIRNIKIDVESITFDNGQSVPYSKSNSSGYVELKIGDASRTVTGKYAYKVNYKVWGAINYFDNEAEFYWNVTGDKWQMPILNSSANVLVGSDQCLNLTGFYGSAGSTDLAQIDKDGVKSIACYFFNQALSNIRCSHLRFFVISAHFW